jgi:hypothetical protein
VFLTRRAAKADLFIWLGSLPPLDTVFTHYSENASPPSFSSVRKSDENRIERTFALTACGLTGVSPSAKGNCSGADLLYAASR